MADATNAKILTHKSIASCRFSAASSSVEDDPRKISPLLDMIKRQDEEATTKVGGIEGVGSCQNKRLRVPVVLSIRGRPSCDPRNCDSVDRRLPSHTMFMMLPLSKHRMGRKHDKKKCRESVEKCVTERDNQPLHFCVELQLSCATKVSSTTVTTRCFHARQVKNLAKAKGSKSVERKEHKNCHENKAMTRFRLSSTAHM